MNKSILAAVIFFVGAVLTYPEVAVLLHVSPKWYSLYLFVVMFSACCTCLYLIVKE